MNTLFKIGAVVLGVCTLVIVIGAAAAVVRLVFL